MSAFRIQGARIGHSPTRFLLIALLVAAAGGALVGRLPPFYVAGIFVLSIVAAIFFWRSGDPMVPFLLLVAALQGGILLRIGGGSGPIQTLTPLLGGWVVLAVVANPQARARLGSVSRAGKWLPGSLVALALIVVLTILAQNWRESGRMLNLQEILTLVQLGILVLISAYLLTSAQKVLAVGYVTIAVGILTSVVALADRMGLINLGTEMTYVEGYTRVSGLHLDPNFFSFQLLISLAFSLYLAVASGLRKWKVVHWLASIVIGGGIVSTYSAGALVGVGAIVTAVVVLQTKISVKRALAALAAILVVVGAVALLAPADYGEAVATKYGELPGSSLEELGTKRGAAWQAGGRAIAANPFLGVGLSTENTQLAIGERYSLEAAERIAAHNTYIGVAVGSGILGLAAFLAILGSCLSILWTAYNKSVRVGNTRATSALGCVLTATVVVAAQGLQLDLEFEKYLWLLVGVSLAVRRWQLASEGTPA